MVIFLQLSIGEERNTLYSGGNKIAYYRKELLNVNHAICSSCSHQAGIGLFR